MRQSRIKPTLRGASIERLNAQQRAFVLALLADRSFNATAAAKVAAYKHPSVAANKLMKNPVVKAILGRAMREREERLQLSADRVLVELGRIAFTNAQDFYQPNGQPKSIHELTAEQSAALQDVDCKVTTNEDGSQSRDYHFRMHNKLQALELLGRHLSVFNDRVQHQCSGGVQLDFTTLLKQVKEQQNVIGTEYIEQLANGNG